MKASGLMINSRNPNIQTACINVNIYTDGNLGLLVQYKKAGADGLMGAMPPNEQGDVPLQYSDKLSPAVNHFLAEASRQDVRVCFVHDACASFADEAPSCWHILFCRYLFSTMLLPRQLLYICSECMEWSVLPLFREVQCLRIPS